MAGTHQTSKDNQKLALALVAALGYASSRQLAYYVYGALDVSSRNMSAKIIKQAKEAGFVKTQRESIHADMLYGLTAKGVREFKAVAADGEAGGKVTGADYLRNAHPHRSACNDVYVAIGRQWFETGLKAHSELEVRRKQTPLNHWTFTVGSEDCTKIPDLVVEKSDGLVWVEVENTYRSDKDLLKLVNTMRSLRLNDRVCEVWVVVTAKSAGRIKERLIRAMTHGPDSGWSARIKAVDAELLAGRLKVYTLDGKTFEWNEK